MNMTGFTKTLGLLALVSVLSGCGNGNRDVIEVLKAVPAAFAARNAEPAGVSQDQIAQALASTTAPINLNVWEDRKTQFLMLEIERNRGYQSFGSSSRQMIIMKDGVITGTRGLSGDLMSSDSDALSAQVRRRQSGTVPYVMRFLTPEDVTISVSFNCAVQALGQSVPIEAGEVSGTGEAVNAICTADTGRSITQTFVVDHKGRVLTTRQWVSDTIGYITVQPLRL